MNLKIFLAKNLDYNKCQSVQEYLLKKVIDNSSDNYLIITSHNNVITLGKNNGEEDLLVSKDYLKENNISLVKSKRGGKATFHGEGQLVIYPILNLRNFNMGVKKYVFSLLDVGINTLKKYGIASYKNEEAPGIYVKKNNQEEKLGFVGIKVERSCSMHGISVNLNKITEEMFKLINPCGYKNLKITSMESLLNKKIDEKEFIDIFIKEFLKIFEYKSYTIKNLNDVK